MPHFGGRVAFIPLVRMLVMPSLHRGRRYCHGFIALKLNSTTRTRHGPDTDRTRTKSTHVVEYELNSTTQTRTRTRHGPDTYKVRARCRVRAKFHYTDPTGPARAQRSFAAKKSVRVRAGPVGSV